MKKFSFLSSVFLLIVVVVFLFVGCQKETAATEEENTTIVSSDGAVVKGIEGTSIVTGLIRIMLKKCRMLLQKNIQT
jgi:uncharacterized protein YcfL